MSLDASSMEALTNGLLDFMKNTPSWTPKVLPQASLSSKQEKKAHMLNRVQQAKYEKELTNISIERKFYQLSSVYDKKLMEYKHKLIEKSKERVARENMQRRNLEEIQQMAEKFFAEQRRRDSLAYHRSETANFIESMTPSKLNKLLQTSLPEAFIDRMLGQEKVRQRKRDQPTSSASSQKGGQKPRTLFDLIRLLKEQGQIKRLELKQDEQSQDSKVAKVKKQRISLQCKLRWRRVFDLMVKQYREKKQLELDSVTPDDSVFDGASESDTRVTKRPRAATCHHLNRGFHGLSLSRNSTASHLKKRGWNSAMSRLSLRYLDTDPKVRREQLLAQEETTQLKMRLKLNRYYRSLENANKLDAKFVSVTSF